MDDPNDRRKSQVIMRAQLDEIEKVRGLNTSINVQRLIRIIDYGAVFAATAQDGLGGTRDDVLLAECVAPSLCVWPAPAPVKRRRLPPYPPPPDPPRYPPRGGFRYVRSYILN
jgi:hypothetical protein